MSLPQEFIDQIRAERALAAQRPRLETQEDCRRAIVSLAMEFPALEDIIFNLGWDKDPLQWNATQFEELIPGLSAGQKLCIKFVLHVWNPRAEMAFGHFDLFAALGRLDSENMAPIRNFISNPWWP